MTLPDCMMPDGAEPCKGFTEALNGAHKQGQCLLKIERIIYAEGVTDNNKLAQIKVLVDRQLKVPDQHAGD